MQWNTALAVPLGAGDFGAPEPSPAVDPDAKRAQSHGRLDGAFHGAAEGDTTLQLLRDVLGDQGRVDLGLADFDDVE